jgi:septum formation protein
VGIEPKILVPTIDESKLPGESTESFLRRVAIAKGEAVYREEFVDIPIISSDTIVICDNRILGKPVDVPQAGEFMKLLSGNVHEVWTGVSILYRGEAHYDFARTGVEFNGISERELQYYLENEDYMDKAGAYAIQGMASVFVKKIDGCYFNVMGFPLNLFYNMLKKIGIHMYK